MEKIIAVFLRTSFCFPRLLQKHPVKTERTVKYRRQYPRSYSALYFLRKREEKPSVSGRYSIVISQYNGYLKWTVNTKKPIFIHILAVCFCKVSPSCRVFGSAFFSIIPRFFAEIPSKIIHFFFSWFFLTIFMYLF